MNAAPQPAQAWRVAALSMMAPNELHQILSSDPQDAAIWVEAAATCGICEAQIRLGRMLLEGDGLALDLCGAFACFLYAAESGNADALNMLGRCYENGWGTNVDCESAVRCYRQAAEAGLAWAQYNYGHMLLDGAGIDRDREAAFVWYGRSAAQGHARAMNLLARCHEEGWGTPCNPAAAREWYRTSAEGGYFRGAFNYASILAGEGNIENAATWFERALRKATEPTRSHIFCLIARHQSQDIREIALTLSPTIT